MKKLKKLLSILFAAVMIFGSVAVGVTGFDFGDIGIKAEAAKFFEDGYYTFRKDDGELRITDCDNSISGTVVIPSEVKGYTVTSIGSMAFYGCSGITKITVPNSITFIDSSAFENCIALESVILPDNPMEISGSAFNNTQVYNDESNWNNDLLYIGNHLIGAKKTISGRCEVEESTKSIASAAFYGCNNLTEISFGENSKLGVIGVSAFRECSSLKAVNIPLSVNKIGDYAFARCSEIKTIEIPDGVTEISNYLFWDCTNLTSVSLPGSVLKIGEYAFSECSTLIDLIIPNCVTSIGKLAFADCVNLTQIVVPDSVKSIGIAAFQDCNGLTQIVLSDNITTISKDLFAGCYGLTNIIIPDGVTNIEELAFPVKMNSTLEYIHIPESVENIEARTTVTGYDPKICSEKDDCYAKTYAEQMGFDFEVCEGHAVSHTHSYTSRTTKDSTCVEQGIRTYTCSCLDEYEENLPLAKHIEGEWETVVKATTDQEGKAVKKCIVCNMIMEEKVLEKLNPDDVIEELANVIKLPSTTTIGYGDAIILHADLQNMPAGGTIKWTASNDNFEFDVRDNGASCKITPRKSGGTTFTATIYDANNNVVGEDMQEMTSKAGFFDKIIAFFKGLFGLTKTYENVFKDRI